jgi:glycosyltransferase involved in cell wall biosynthesis
LSGTSFPLIEAISCGLPAVVLNDGGHPELIQKGGELFLGKEDILQKINKVAGNYSYYQSRLPRFSIEDASQRYLDFCQKIFEDAKNGYYLPRQIGVQAAFSFNFRRFKVFLNRLFGKIRGKI